METKDNNPLSTEGFVLMNNVSANLRDSVRYEKTKNVATLRSAKFIFTLFSRPFSVRLVDVSGRGAKIETGRNLNIRGEYELAITFADERSFVMLGTIVRKDPARANCYGFKFKTVNKELGEYLFRTHTHSIF